MTKKTIRNKQNESNESITWYSLPDVVADASKKSKVFARRYQEEVARINMSQQIKQARMGAHLTQRKLANKAGMPQSVIARIEGGAHGVSLDTLSRVAWALGKEVQLV